MDEVAEGPRTLLVTLTGRDRPGVTSRLFGALAAYPVEVVDIEQVVIRGRLVLGVLVSLGTGTNVPKIGQAIERVADGLGMEAELATGATEGGSRCRGRLHVTVLGNPLRPGAIAGIAGRVTACGANIDRIVRLARYPVTCVELETSGAELATLRAGLAAEAAVQRVDVAVQRSGLYR